ncbi:YcnI family protein [Mycolicibacterium nivoides]|uniref:YcnI family copper-binding membrane protein n=1 Tax=Mycolicibacterium nivoides TaxID=2487344 RepID=UPI001F14DCB7|nr:YcnI family protein [Mycolicibacterium nivoides]
MIVTAAPAAAHVRVDEGQQPPRGGYGIVRLIVPTESEQASTIGVTVTVPDNIELTSARTLPIPGWTANVETEPTGDGQRVSRITWRAIDKAGGIKPTEYGEFAFSAGPWPENAETVPLLSDQSYSDGSVVSWNEIAVDKDSEPEHPAPVVTLGAAEAGHTHDGHGAPTLVPAGSPGGESWLWRATSVVALLLALGSSAALAVTLRRRS